MTNSVIDNTDAGNLDRTIIWQYDNAEKLIGVIEMLKDFFAQSTTDFFDNYAKKINLANPDEVDPYIRRRRRSVSYRSDVIRSLS